MNRLTIGLEQLEDDINNMSENEVKNKRLDYLKDLIKNIITAGQKFDDMPEEEIEIQYTPPRYFKKGTGLKIMTPNQLITRLPILLAQKQAGNNSNKLNNEIRQIIYS